MLNRLAFIFIVSAVLLAVAAVRFAAGNRETEDRSRALKAENLKMSRELAALRSLPATSAVSDLEKSFVLLAADISALREMGGTVATVAVDGVKAGEPVTSVARKVGETEVSAVPMLIEIREYKYFEGLLEAISSLSRRDILVESIRYENGLTIRAKLFGRNGHGKS